MTQAIQPDRTAVTVSDRERPLQARADTAKPVAAGDQAPVASAPPATRDAADVAQGSALLRATAPRRSDDAPIDGAQAAAKTARLAELLRGEPARAMQAYAGVRRDDVQALLATA